jgi:hypothetical protein
MVVLSIDPGNTHTALVWLSDSSPVRVQYCPNDVALELVRTTDVKCVVSEMVACYGMPVGSEVFDTCVMIGRLWEASPAPFHRVFRKDVKMHLCGRANAKDANIRQALIDRFGPGREVAIGTKKKPGPLYEISGDLWAALAVGVTWWDHQGAAPAVNNFG